MAGEALSRADEPTASFKLTPGPHGKLEVIADGRGIAEHRHAPNTDIFLDIQDLIEGDQRPYRLIRRGLLPLPPDAPDRAAANRSA
jgi:hypothetical protein